MLCHHASHNERRWRVGTPNPWQWFLPPLALMSYPWCDKLKTSLIKTFGDVSWGPIMCIMPSSFRNWPWLLVLPAVSNQLQLSDQQMTQWTGRHCFTAIVLPIQRFPAHVPKKWSECETPERNRSFFGVHLYQDSIICKHPLFFGCFWWVRCMISLFISIISGCLWWGSGEEKENGWHRSRDPHLTPDSWEISTGRENYKPWEKCWVLQWVLQHRYGKPLNLTQFLDHFPWKVHEIHGFSTSIAGSEICRLGSRPVSASPSCRLQSWFDETELDLSG